MNNDAYINLLKEEAKQKREDAIEELMHPLSKYSTSELKRELKRRKGQVQK